MKKLLAIALLFSFTTYMDAEETIYRMDITGNIHVWCVNDFVFVENTRGGSITQMFATGDMPMRCQAYKNIRDRNKKATG